MDQLISIKYTGYQLKSTLLCVLKCETAHKCTVKEMESGMEGIFERDRMLRNRIIKCSSKQSVSGRKLKNVDLCAEFMR